MLTKKQMQMLKQTDLGDLTIQDVYALRADLIDTIKAARQQLRRVGLSLTFRERYGNARTAQEERRANLMEKLAKSGLSARAAQELRR